MLGTDRSVGLLKTAQEKSEGYQLFAADSLCLPVRSESCDAFISIAVIQHQKQPIQARANLETSIFWAKACNECGRSEEQFCHKPRKHAFSAAP